MVTVLPCHQTVLTNRNSIHLLPLQRNQAPLSKTIILPSRTQGLLVCHCLDWLVCFCYYATLVFKGVVLLSPGCDHTFMFSGTKGP